jgi:bacterial mobilization protein MobC
VRERMRPEHLNYMAQLKGIARNLNQLTRSANAGGFAAEVAPHAAIITQIEDFLKQLRHDR